MLHFPKKKSGKREGERGKRERERERMRQSNHCTVIAIAVLTHLILCIEKDAAIAKCPQYSDCSFGTSSSISPPPHMCTNLNSPICRTDAPNADLKIMKFYKTKQVATELVKEMYMSSFFVLKSPPPPKNVHVMTAFTPELCAHAVLKMCVVQTVGVLCVYCHHQKVNPKLQQPFEI